MQTSVSLSLVVTIVLCCVCSAVSDPTLTTTTYPPSNPFFGTPTNAFGAPTTNPFGAPITNPFGAPTTNPFGTPATNPFGAPTTAAPGVNLFGTSVFGATTPTTNPTMPPPLLTGEGTGKVELKVRVESFRGREWLPSDVIFRRMKNQFFVSFPPFTAFEEIEAIEVLSLKNLADYQASLAATSTVRFARAHTTTASSSSSEKHTSSSSGSSPGAHALDPALLELQEKLGVAEEIQEEVQETVRNAVPDVTFKLVGDDLFRHFRFNPYYSTAIFNFISPIAERKTMEQQYFLYSATTKEMWASLKSKYPNIVSIGVRSITDVMANPPTIKSWYIGLDLLWDLVTYPQLDFVKTRDLVLAEAKKILTIATIPHSNIVVQWVSNGDPLINMNNLFRKDAEHARFEPLKYGGFNEQPMMGGINTGFRNSNGGLGTIGGFLIRHPGVLFNDPFDAFAVSNAHIWRGAIGTDACQPSEALYRSDAPTGLGNRQCEGLTPETSTCCQSMGKIYAHRANLPVSNLNNVFNATTAGPGVLTNPATGAGTNTWGATTAPPPVVLSANNYHPLKFVRDFAITKLDFDIRYRFRCSIQGIGVINGASRFGAYLSRSGVTGFDTHDFEFHDPRNYPARLLLNDVLKFGSRTHLTGGRVHDYFPRSQAADLTVVGRRSAANPRAMPISFSGGQIFTDPLFPGSVVPNGDFKFIADIRTHFVRNAPVPSLHIEPQIDTQNKTQLFNELWHTGRLMSAFAFTGDSGAFVNLGPEVVGQLHEAVWVAARPDEDLGLPGEGLDATFPCHKGGCTALGAVPSRETVSFGRVKFYGYYLKTRVLAIDFVVDEVNAALRNLEGKNYAPVMLCNEADRLGYVVGRPPSICQFNGSVNYKRCGPKPICKTVTNSTGSFCELRPDL